MTEKMDFNRRHVLQLVTAFGAGAALDGVNTTNAAEAEFIRAIMHKVHQDMQQSILPEMQKEGLSVRITTGPINQVEEGFVREARVQPSGFDVGFQKPEWFDAPRFDLLEPLGQWQLREPIVDFGDILASLLEAGQFNGAQYMIPVRTGAYVLHYRKDLFDQYSLGEPATIEELGEAMRTISAKTDVYGFTAYGRADAQWQVLHNLAAAFGGRLFDEAGKPAMAEAGTVAALEWYAKLFKDKMISPDHLVMDVDGSNRLLMEGRTAVLMDLGSRWSLFTDPTRSKVAGKLGWMVLPPARAMVGKKIGGYASTWSLAIPKRAQKKQLAWRYIRMLLDPKVQIVMAQQGNDPVRRSTWASKELIASYADRGASTLPAVTQKALERATAPWPNGTAGTAKITEIIGQSVHRTLLGNATAQQAMNDAADQIRAIKA